MTPIKFGTDGWRAIIAKDFTIENLVRVAEATALWLLKNYKEPAVVLGHDTRFGGQLFAETTCQVLCHYKIKVYLAKNFVSTPMVSLGTVKLKASLGIIITASHNPASYNGYKLKASYGGPLEPGKISEIENLIGPAPTYTPGLFTPGQIQKQGLLEYVDLESMYCQHAETHFDLTAIRSSGFQLAYDAMYGAGQNVMSRLLPGIAMLHCEHNPSFNNQAPEPIHKNLQEFSQLIRISNQIDCGIATDGDADRIGLYDQEGNFIDSNHIMLLLIKYLCEEKAMKGKVVTSFSVSPKIQKMCAHFGLDHEVTKVGFKYIAPVMANEDVLLGGEESGGIALKGHIPERDGIWTALTLLECMCKTGKTLRELINDVYALVGPFAFERFDLHLEENVKNRIVENCRANYYSNFGDYEIKRVESTDGYKFFFTDDEWLMIRASGTEPVLRNYAESASHTRTLAILRAAEQTLLQARTGSA